MLQAGLFDVGEPSFDPELSRGCRQDLGDGAWLEHRPSWLNGHQRVFEQLLSTARWQRHSRQMYDRAVEVPRLTAALPERGEAAELMRRIANLLSSRYQRPLKSIALAHYRDGRDSVAPHGDKMGSLAHDTVIAILSVGSPRRFTLRSVQHRSTRRFQLGWGDLLVLGGSCQKTFLHGVPKVARAGPRISIQFREALPDAEGERLAGGLLFTRTVSRSFVSS